MLQPLDREKTFLDKFLTLPVPPRIQRMKDRFFSRKLTATIDRDLIDTRVMKETEGEPMVTRKAKVFSAVVRELPIHILPDELLVGWLDPLPDSCPLGGKQLKNLEELLDDDGENSFGKRKWSPIVISDEQKALLREEVIPYWRGNGKWERIRYSSVHDIRLPPKAFEYTGPPDPEDLSSKMGNISGTHIGHTVCDTAMALEKGFLGIKKHAEERIQRLDLSDPEDLEKLPFLQGVAMAMEAAAELGSRFADIAREQAEDEQDAVRKAELLKLAEVCDQIPAHPARTFYEALQCAWFVQILQWWETRDTTSISPGRVDQYLYPFYEKDIREGRITREEAQELIDCYLVRFSWYASYIPMGPEGHAITDIYGSGIHLGVGGLGADGRDATNDLSYMFIEGMMHTHLPEPNFGVMVHSKTPEDFLIKACQLCAIGGGHPIFINQDDLINNLLGRETLGGPPITLETARASGIIGCNEPAVTGMDSGYAVGSGVFLHLVMLNVLTNGGRRNGSERPGVPDTGDPSKFESFEEFKEAFKIHMAWTAERGNIVTNVAEKLLAEMDPTVFQSALINDCIEKGKSREDGGARYNFGPFVSTLAIPDTGDSLTAIRKLVYEDKKITVDELCDALEANFEGYEDLQRLLLDAPKFGQGHDYADEQVAWVMHEFCQESIKHKNTRGGHMIPLNIALSNYVTFGRFSPALPNGRLSGVPLSDSIAPTTGNDVDGPTAVLRAVGKLNNAEMFAGSTLNMRLDPVIFDDDLGVKRFADFIRTFVDEKIHHVQFTIVSTDTLRAAQEKPEDYGDLLVRIAGYCAHFVRLPKDLQDSVIARTEHAL